MNKIFLLFILIPFTYSAAQHWVQTNPPFHPGYDNVDKLTFVNDSTAFFTMGRELWRTTDKGTTVTKILNLQSPEWVLSIQSFGDTIIVAGNTFMLRSFDKGMTFQKYNVPQFDFITNKFSFLNSMIAYQLGTPRYVIRKSSDGGFTWSTINLQFYIKDVYFTDYMHGWATSDEVNWGNRLYKTTDGGYTWSGTQMGQDELLYFSGSKDKIILKQSNWKMFITTNGGDTWIPRPLNFVASGFIISDNYIIASNSYKKFYISYDLCQTWVPHFSVTSYNVATPDGITFLSGAQFGNLFRTTDVGITWNTLTSCNFSLSSISYVDESNIFASGTHMMRTSNGGLNWEPVFNDFPHLDDLYFVNKTTGFAFTYSYDTVIGYTTIFLKTTNRGDTWNVIHQKIQNYAPEKIYFKDNNNGYAIGGNFYYRTTDGGVTWDYSNSQGISGRDINFYNSQSGFITGSYGGFFTSDGGDTWIAKPNIDGYCIFFIDSLSGWRGKNWAIQKTTDGGATFFNLFDYGQDDWFSKITFFNPDTGFMEVQYSGPGEIVKTTDGGYSFNYILGYPDIYRPTSAFIAPNLAWVADTYGGIFKYTDEQVPVEILSLTAIAEGL